MIGQTLGHYRIEERLGAGGMGVVYRAQDTRLQRTVALKLLGDGAPVDEAARERLLQEARAASALNHPHICTIYEVGEAEGQAYIAMEYVGGRPLSALVPGEGLPVETAVRYGAQIADALAHAHERGVVHRDLKSANVVITPEGRAKVLDFGLARRLPQEELEQATRSRVALGERGAEAEGVAGTLHYMAPEVLRGEAADARSDQWALGVLLYEMAAGVLPFQGKTGFELSSAILREAPAPLPARVPAALRAVIQRCLAKEPGQRYPRAGEVRAAIETIQSDTALVPPMPAPKASRRGWLWAFVAIGVLVAAGVAVRLITGKTVFIGLMPPGRPEAPVGPRLSTGAPASANKEANEYFEKAMLFLITQLDLVRGRQMLERALQLDPHFAEARAWHGFTEVLTLRVGFSNDTSALYRAEEELRSALRDDPNSPEAHSFLAAAYLCEGRKELVPGEIEKALKENPDDPQALVWLNRYYQFNGDYAAAEAALKRAAQRQPLFFPVSTDRAEILRQQGNTSGAVRELEKVLEQDPQNYLGIHDLARAYLDAGDLRQARLTLERARAADRQNFLLRADRSLLLALEGRKTEAQKEMDGEVVKYASGMIFVTSWVAEFYAVLGDTSKALEWLDRALRNGDERSEWFRRDPLLANVREHPRFQQILESMAFRHRQRGQAARRP